MPRAEAGLSTTIPALPVADVAVAARDYAARLGFEARYVDDGFAVLARDAAVLHLWAAGDDGWRGRPGPAGRPVRSGAESFLAGTASCRIEVVDVDALFAELRDAGALHPATGEVVPTDFGTREFAALDLDGNQLTFFAPARDR